MPAYLLTEPRKTKDFVDVRHAARVAELFQTFLAIEAVSNQPLADDLRSGALPEPPATDRPALGGGV